MQSEQPSAPSLTLLDLTTPWQPPEHADIIEALRWASERRPASVTRTIKLKLHNPSRRKQEALLQAQYLLHQPQVYHSSAAPGGPANIPPRWRNRMLGSCADTAGRWRQTPAIEAPCHRDYGPF